MIEILLSSGKSVAALLTCPYFTAFVDSKMFLVLISGLAHVSALETNFAARKVLT